MTATTERLKAYVVHVHLSDSEYQWSTRQPDGTWKYRNDDGTPIDNMRAAATEAFDAHPDKTHMVVHVIEHGGWHLAFNRDLVCMETANDQAVLSPAAYAYGELLKGAEWIRLPGVRRGDP